MSVGGTSVGYKSICSIGAPNLVFLIVCVSASRAFPILQANFPRILGVQKWSPNLGNLTHTGQDLMRCFPETILVSYFFSNNGLSKTNVAGPSKIPNMSSAEWN